FQERMSNMLRTLEAKYPGGVVDISLLSDACGLFFWQQRRHHRPMIDRVSSEIETSKAAFEALAEPHREILDESVATLARLEIEVKERITTHPAHVELEALKARISSIEAQLSSVKSHIETELDVPGIRQNIEQLLESI